MTATKSVTGRVFLFEPPNSDKIDVSAAAQYGQIDYLFRPRQGEKTRSSIFDTEKLADEIVSALEAKEYDPAKDYLCVSGHINSIIILTATAVAEYGLIRALLFDTRERNYIVRELGRDFNES